jgi:hypothetical protein
MSDFYKSVLESKKLNLCCVNTNCVAQISVLTPVFFFSMTIDYKMSYILQVGSELNCL